MTKRTGLAAILILTALSPLPARADASPEPTVWYVQNAINSYCAPAQRGEAPYALSDREMYRTNLRYARMDYRSMWRQLPDALRTRAYRIIVSGRAGCTR